MAGLDREVCFIEALVSWSHIRSESLNDLSELHPINMEGLDFVSLHQSLPVNLLLCRDLSSDTEILQNRVGLSGNHSSVHGPAAWLNVFTRSKRLPGKSSVLLQTRILLVWVTLGHPHPIPRLHIALADSLGMI